MYIYIYTYGTLRDVLGEPLNPLPLHAICMPKMLSEG